MNCGKVEEPSSSPSQYPSTARFAATSAILTVILSRSDRAPSSSTVSARPGWDSHLNGCGCSLEPFPAAVSSQYFGLDQDVRPMRDVWRKSCPTLSAVDSSRLAR